MRRIAVGMTVGLAVWFGSAVAAEAQWIQPTGPLAIHVGQGGTTYTATVQLPSLQDYAVQLKVYRGTNLTTPIYTCEQWFYSPTQLTNYFSKAVTWSPNAIFNQKYTFKAKLILTDGSQPIDASDWIKFVTYPPGPGTYLMPSKSSNLAFEAIDRDRRHEA